MLNKIIENIDDLVYMIVNTIMEDESDIIKYNIEILNHIMRLSLNTIKDDIYEDKELEEILFKIYYIS